MNTTYFENNNYLNIPAWARAENFEQCESLEKLWGLDDAVRKSRRLPQLRKGIAHLLYSLADQIDTDEKRQLAHA